MTFWDSYNRRVQVEASRVYLVTEVVDVMTEEVSSTHCRVAYSIGEKDFSLIVARPYDEVRIEWRAKKQLVAR